jgi:hypothetical protein
LLLLILRLFTDIYTSRIKVFSYSLAVNFVLRLFGVFCLNAVVYTFVDWFLYCRDEDFSVSEKIPEML